MGEIVAERTFRTGHGRVYQDPREAQLGEFVASRGGIEMTLSVRVYLNHVGIVDPGDDFFSVALTVKKPPRWIGAEVPEDITVNRVVDNLAAVRDWLHQLESGIAVVLFHNQGVGDRGILRLLLELVDQTRQLDAVVARDLQVRRRLLGR